MEPIDPQALKERRQELGLTQRQLATLCRCSQAAIGRLETGDMKRCSEDLANQIVRWLDINRKMYFRVSAKSRKDRSINGAGTIRHKVAA